MYTIRNSNNGQETTCTDIAHVRRILRNIVKQYGREALAGIYVDEPGERDAHYTEDLV